MSKRVYFVDTGSLSLEECQDYLNALKDGYREKGLLVELNKSEAMHEG